MSLVVVSIGIDDRNLGAVHLTDGIDSDFTIIEAVIDPLDGWALENANGIREGDAVPPHIRKVLSRVPSEPHSGIYDP